VQSAASSRGRHRVRASIHNEVPRGSAGRNDPHAGGVVALPVVHALRPHFACRQPRSRDGRHARYQSSARAHGCVRPGLRACGDRGRVGRTVVDCVAVHGGECDHARVRGRGYRRARLVPRGDRRRPGGGCSNGADDPVQARRRGRLDVCLHVPCAAPATARTLRRTLGALRMTVARRRSSPIIVIGAVLLVISVVNWAFGAPINRVTQIAIYALYAIGVNFLIGYLGLVPFGASFFFGCASYALAIFSGSVSGSNEVTGVAIAIAFSLVLALLVGAVILRRRGLYFSLLTLAC